MQLNNGNFSFWPYINQNFIRHLRTKVNTFVHLIFGFTRMNFDGISSYKSEIETAVWQNEFVFDQTFADAVV